MSDLAIFGYAAHGASSAMRERIAQLSLRIGEEAKMEIAVSEAQSYEELGRSVAKGDVDVAWVPPIPFIALERSGAAVPILSMHRGGATDFHAVLIVAADAPFETHEDLAGTRAAWVDRFSASGYVVPRVELAARGLDPRVSFGEERFWRSHEGVVRAIAAGRADFAGTYAGIDKKGDVVRGPWMDLQGADDRIRVLTRFGIVPGDVIAARAGLPEPLRERIARAFLMMSREAAYRLLLQDAFGVDELRRFTGKSYDELRAITEDATARGWLEAEETVFEDDDEDEGTPPEGVPVPT